MPAIASAPVAEPTNDQWELAGKVAAGWFERLNFDLTGANIRSYPVIVDEVLDDALSQAGIIPEARPMCVVCSDDPTANCMYCPAV